MTNHPGRVGREISRRDFIKGAALVVGAAAADAVVLLAACAPKEEIIAPSPGVNEVWIIGWNYVPETINVPLGTTITWTNTNREFHTVTSDDNLFDGHLGANESFSHTFTQKGVFDYHDAVTDPPIPGRVIVE